MAGETESSRKAAEEKRPKRIGNVSPKLKIVNVFQTNDRAEFMRRFTIDGCVQRETFCAPLDQLTLNRRYPVARELA